MEDIDTTQEDHIYDMTRYVMMANVIAPRKQHDYKPLGDDPLDLRPKHDRYDFYRR